MMFTVSQYDSYGYLFYQPTFISLDPTAKPTSIPIKGIRIGINGTIPQVGQAYIPLNTTVTAAGYTAQGELLSTVGTVIALRERPADGSVLPAVRHARQPAHDVIVEPTPTAPPTLLGPVVADSACAPSRRSIPPCRSSPGVPTTNAR